MSLTDPYELDATSAVSNSNYGGANIAEGCPPSSLNNALRYLGSMLALATSYQSAAISASVSTNIAATGTGYYMSILGANAINSFGVVPGARPSANPFRILEFSSSASLSHGSRLILGGGASRRTQPGDVGMYIHEGSSDVWREALFYPATGYLSSISNDTITYAKMQNVSAASRLLGRGSAGGAGDVEEISLGTGLAMSTTTLSAEDPAYAYGESATYDSTTTVMLNDNSIPQITEGKEITTATITPKRATSKLLITVSALVTHSSADEGVTLAVFVDATAGAIGANVGGTGKTSVPQAAMFQFMIDASSTSARTYRLRYGPATAGTAYINGDTGARQLGGVSKATLMIEEIFV